MGLVEVLYHKWKRSIWIGCLFVVIVKPGSFGMTQQILNENLRKLTHSLDMFFTLDKMELELIMSAIFRQIA